MGKEASTRRVRRDLYSCFLNLPCHLPLENLSLPPFCVGWTLSWPYNGVFALLEGDCAILFMYIFPTHSGIGMIFSAKLGQKSQFCARNGTKLHETARNGTNWHATTLKVANKRCFTPQNTQFFAAFAIFTLTQPIYPPTGRYFCASGLWTFGPKSSVGYGKPSIFPHHFSLSNC